MEKQYRFKREERLKSRDRIRILFKRGKVTACAGAKLFFLENELPNTRIAFTFARKYGNAVKRNRSRRLSREAYRHIRPNLKPGYDMALLVYPGRDEYELRKEQLRVLFKRAFLLAEKNQDG